jgi:hypothetical protein
MSADEFIAADAVKVSPRGRRKVLNQDLLATLAKVTPKQGVALRGTFGEVAKSDRPAVAATIRKHWREIRTEEVRIDFTPEGVAQVRVRA